MIVELPNWRARQREIKFSLQCTTNKATISNDLRGSCLSSLPWDCPKSPSSATQEKVKKVPSSTSTLSVTPMRGRTLGSTESLALNSAKPQAQQSWALAEKTKKPTTKQFEVCELGKYSSILRTYQHKRNKLMPKPVQTINMRHQPCL